MSLTVNQSLNAPANVASVFAGTEQRRAPLAEDNRLSGLAGGNAGTGIRASQQVINQLDNERNQRSNFQNANTNSNRGQQAVAAYQSQQNEQRRAEVQSLLGVDLYA
jgi:Sec-independent protein translocase protein TatA